MALGTTAALIAGGAALVGAGATAYSANKAAGAQEDAANAALSQEERMFNTQRADYAPVRAAGSNALAAIQYELGIGSKPYFAAGPGYDTDGNILGVYYSDVTGSEPNAPEPTIPVAPNAPGAPQGPLFATGDDGGTNALAQNLTDATTSQEAQYRAELQAYERAMAEYQRRKNAPDQLIEYQGFQATPGYEFRVAEGQKAIDRAASARGMSMSGALLKDQERFAQGIAADEYGTYFNRLQSLAGQGQTATNSLANLGSNYANSASNILTNRGNAQAQGANNIGSAITGGINGLAGAYGMSQGYGGGYGSGFGTGGYSAGEQWLLGSI